MKYKVVYTEDRYEHSVRHAQQVVYWEGNSLLIALFKMRKKAKQIKHERNRTVELYMEN